MKEILKRRKKNLRSLDLKDLNDRFYGKLCHANGHC